MKTTLILQALLGLLLALPAMAGQSVTTTSPDQVPEGLGKSDWQSIRAAHEGWKHRFHAGEGGWQANNPGQQWTTRFDGRGFVATPKDANWTWGLQFQSYGFGGNLIEVSGTPEVRAGEQRLTYQWDDNIEEWFVNDQRGLEHGFIIKERPDGGRTGDPLVFTMSTVGSLKPTVSADAQTVHFRDGNGAPVLNYSGLKVWDADGTVLTSCFESRTGGTFRLVVEESGARYPLTIDPIAQQAYLKASNTPGNSGSGDQFGYWVALDGDTIVVGAPYEDSSTTGINTVPDNVATDSGAAYVFVRSGGVWSQQAYLKASNTGADDNFGYSVAISADTVVIGAQQEDSNTTGSNSTPNESASNSGAAYVFVRSGGLWSQQAYLKSSNTDAGDRFAHSIAVSADTVVVGAIAEDSNATGVNGDGSNNSVEGISSGAAYVFVRSGGIWSEQAYLKASNSGANDNFGYSVSVNLNTIVVGAEREDSSTTGINSTPNNNTTDAGAAYVFFRSGSTWSQQAYLKASNTTVTDVFGRSVAVSGETVVVGSAGEDSSTMGVNSSPNENALDSGAAYVFVRSGSVWTQQAYLKASNTGQGDQLGHSVALSGNTLVVGAIAENSSTTGVNSTPNETAPYFGAAYVFVRSGSTWSQQAYLKASNAFRDDRFGWSVAVSGDTVVVGANWENSGASGINGTPDLQANQAGSGYVFTRSGSAWTQQAYLKSGNSSGNSFDRFGVSVAVSGDTVVVGSESEDSGTTGVNSIPNESASSSGAAYVFLRSGGVWSQQAYLKASNTGVDDGFGSAVAVSGNTVVVGAKGEDSSTTGVNSTPNESSSYSGAAYVFVRTGGIWNQQAYLKASNTGLTDAFGNSVAVSGETVIVGAPQERSSTTGVNSTPNDTASDSGAAYVFVRSGSVWSQQAYLKASNTGAADYFGYSVAVSGETVVVGAYSEDSSTTGVNSTSNNTATDAGAAYVFVRSGSSWSQQVYLKASNTGANDNFGQSVAASGDTVVVGANREDSSTTGVNSTPGEGASDSGAAYAFVRTANVWSQQAYLKASNTGADDQFGIAVAVSGNTLIVGADREDSSTTGVNSIPNEGASSSGAAYAFVRIAGVWTQQAYLKASNSEVGDSFGVSVAVSEDTVIVGASAEDSSTTGVNSTPNENSSLTGAAYIFSGLGPVLPSPEIAIEKAGSDVSTGSTHPFGAVATGGHLERAFTVLNTGMADLLLSGSPKVAVTGSADFTVTAQPASPISAPSGSSTFTVRFTPTGSGLKSATLSMANNDGDENPFVIELTGTATTANALFATAVTSGTGLTGDAALPNATPFNDGIENLLKYAFNMNLAGPDAATMAAGGTAGLPVISQAGTGAAGVLCFEFVRRAGSGLLYTPKKSTTLGPAGWIDVTDAPTVTPIGTDGLWERVIYEEPSNPALVPACFGRVEVAIP